MNLRFFRKKEFFWLVLLIVVFVMIRIPAIDSPLHQDEYKWPIIVNPELTEPGGIPHPPVGEFIYKTAGQTIGFDNFRMVPFIFSFINIFLLFYLAKIIFGRKGALWTTLFFIISFYSVLASLMVDTDGAIIPFFFLLMTIGYIKLKNQDFNIKREWKWLVPIALGIIGGFLVKVSFVIAISALVLDFAIYKRVLFDKKKLLKYSLFVLGGLGILGIILLLSKFIFPHFRFEWTLNYWKGFIKFGSRGWFQSFIQFTKAVLYSSPLLILPLLFINKEIFKKLRPFFLFIFIGLFFYLFLFDFSTGAIDRYFQFSIIPLSLISGAVFARFLNSFQGIDFKKVTLPLVAGVTIFLFQFLNHFTPSLHPKTEWINRIISGQWNFLFPFMGGSGPTPFYVSFLFVALIWISALALVMFAFKKRDFTKGALIGILILGIFYNGVFVEEYLFGKINGSTPELVKEATTFIVENEDIKKVTVYNDNGGNEIRNTGKYRKRLYIDPKFDVEDKIGNLNKYKEHYLVIDIPKINPESIYMEYFNSCQSIYEKQSGKISANIYDCKNTPNLDVR
jgi:4-amino-4-deoxy-L-arabinose transferase-like glycosyltransferase